MANKLRGKRVLVTRAAGQNKELSRQLETVGAEPVEFPTIQITLPTDTGPLDKAITDLGDYDWLILTSVNGVEFFWQRLAAAGKTVADLQHLQLATVGPATAAAAESHGLIINLMPSKHLAEGLLEAMANITGQRILYPTADIARPVLAEGLTANGNTVNRVTAYQTGLITERGNLPELLPTLNALTFTSASTVRGFVGLLKTDNPVDAIGSATVVCIGPIAAEAARELGLPVHVIAKTFTVPGLVEALENYFCKA